MIEVLCDLCPEELREQGALVFGPPDEDGLAHKFHVCLKCWTLVLLPAIRDWSRLARE